MHRGTEKHLSYAATSCPTPSTSPEPHQPPIIPLPFVMLATGPAGLRKTSLSPLSTISTNPKQCSDAVVLRPERTSEGCKEIAGPSPRVVLQQV